MATITQTNPHNGSRRAKPAGFNNKPYLMPKTLYTYSSEDNTAMLGVMSNILFNY